MYTGSMLFCTPDNCRKPQVQMGTHPVPVFNELLVLYYTEFGNYFDHIAHSKSSKRQHIRVQQPLKHTNTGLKYF